jgi:hypothetical protein
VSTGIAVKEDYENGAGGFLTAADAGSTLTSDLAVSAAPPLAIANLATGGAVGASVHNFGLIQSTVVDAALHTWNVNKQQAVKKMWTRNWLTSYVWRKGERLADWWYGDNPCP